MTDQSGNRVARHDYLPFGVEIPAGFAGRTSAWGTADNVSAKFTGKERDTDNGINLDFFQARYHGAAQARFLSPDPAGNFVADLSNPQSWNQYSYVLNNPLKFVDPSGLNCVYAGADNGTAADYADPTNYIDDNNGGQTCAEVDVSPPEEEDVTARWNDIGAYGALWDWMWGTSAIQNFNGNDTFTQQLMQSSHITHFLNTLRQQFNSCAVPASAGTFNRNLGAFNPVQRSLIYAKDGLNVATGGLTGNVAQSLLGSYQLAYSLSNVDLDGGTATVNITVTNTWSFGSATRNPISGYSSGYNENQRPSWLPPGAMSPSTQTFSWSSTLGFNNTGCVY